MKRVSTSINSNEIQPHSKKHSESSFSQIVDCRNEGPDSSLNIAEGSPSLILYSHEHRPRTTEENFRIGDIDEGHLRKTRKGYS